MIPAGARPGSRDAWTWGEDTFPPIDFAVQALVRDGMSVPPFDSHADGDGTLTAGGLTPEAWLAWVYALIDLNSSMGELTALVGEDLPAESLARGRALGEQMMEPWSVIDASDRVRVRLRRMWDEYRRATRAWEQPLALGERGARRLEARLHRSLWNDLSRLYERLPMLSVYLVDYPTPAVMPVPPTTAVIAPAPDPAAYADQIRLSARQLASDGNGDL
jgi:hypothetical protein